MNNNPQNTTPLDNKYARDAVEVARSHSISSIIEGHEGKWSLGS
jgi:hypothetical protein